MLIYLFDSPYSLVLLFYLDAQSIHNFIQLILNKDYFPVTTDVFFSWKVLDIRHYNRTSRARSCMISLMYCFVQQQLL